MKIAVVLARHRRLLALCGLSLLLHLVVMEWIAHAARPSVPLAAVPAPLALRLAPPPPGAADAQQAPASARPLPPEPSPRATASMVPGPAARAAAQAPAPAEGPPQGQDMGDEPGTALVRMPGRYRVRMPPPALLSYSLVRSRPGRREAAAGSARIVWQRAGDKFRIQTDGVPGRLTSEGASDDAGIAPTSASELRADGTLATTTFDAEGRRIVFSGSPRSYPMNEGSQDRASVLMQLAGIGLAEPDQVKDVIEIFVGTAEDARVVRYQVLGQEEVATRLGTFATWRLVQLAAPGERRFEVWLAPARNWYPVQLRATDPDGLVTTQVLAAIGEAAALP